MWRHMNTFYLHRYINIKGISSHSSLNLFVDNWQTHIGPARGHEDDKVCQMITGAGCVGLVDMRVRTALDGPVTFHVAQWIVPESTFGLISFRVYMLIEKIKVRLI